MSIEELQKLPGVGPATAEALITAGYPDPGSLAVATVEQLAEVKGFAEARALALIQSARGEQPAVQVPEQSEPGASDDSSQIDEEAARSKAKSKELKRLRARQADLDKRAKKARKKAKSASSKKKRKRWAAKADQLAKKAKKAKKRLKALN